MFWGALTILAYVFVGYPLILLLASIVIRAGRAREAVPSVTLIIPAHNEAQVIEEKLKNAMLLDYPKEKLEMIVASDGSSDDTVQLARQFEKDGVRVAAYAAQRGKTSTVNETVGMASGEVLLLCDANVMFEPTALKILVNRLAEPGVGAVTGDVRLASHQSTFGVGESWYYRLERQLQLGESKIGSVMGVDGGMYVIRKDCYQPPPADCIIDDFLISMGVIQKGKRIVYEPRAVAHESGTPNVRQEWRRRMRISAGAAQSLKRFSWPSWRQPLVTWQYLSHKLFRWMSPFFLFLLLVSNVMLLSAGIFYQVMFLGQVTLYLIAVLAAFSLRFRSTQPGGIAFYFVFSQLATAHGLLRGFLDLQQVTWSHVDRQPAVEFGEHSTRTNEK